MSPCPCHVGFSGGLDRYSFSDVCGTTLIYSTWRDIPHTREISKALALLCVMQNGIEGIYPGREPGDYSAASLEGRGLKWAFSSAKRWAVSCWREPHCAQFNQSPPCYPILRCQDKQQRYDVLEGTTEEFWLGGEG